MAAEQSVIEHAFINAPNIEWRLLSQALEHYRRIGYDQVETPWVIPKPYMDGTKPHDHETFELHQGQFTKQHHELVGSAEQGFVYMKAQNLLPSGDQFMSVSPCFRVEHFDETHLPWFMKLELFINDTNPERLEYMIEDCVAMFETLNDRDYCPFEKIEVVRVGDTFDIEMNGIEIGSYGIRRHFNRAEGYIYGTGIALPRFTQARGK
jgi:hypothetical protein